MNAFDYFFENSASSNKDFLLGRSEQVTFYNLYSNCLALSVFLREHTKPDEKIIILSQNNVFFLTAYLGILKSGRVCVPLNPDIEKSNLEYIIAECDTIYLFVDSKILHRFDLKDFSVISNFESTNSISKVISELELEFDDSRIAEIIFTSGSTGIPKGVMISHRNIITNTDSIIEYLNLSSEDIMEVVLPFYYCYGLSLLHTHLRVCGAIVFNNSFIFLGSVLNDLQKYKCTGFAGVPSHFQILLRKSESFKTQSFPNLRYVTQAGGKLHTVFIKEFIESHPEIDFIVMYGQTEATARLSYLPLKYLKTKIGSIGKGIPGVELRVVDENNNNVKQNVTGEIIARGENVMLGYYRDTEASRETIRNGWLYTGDMGEIDTDGFIYLTARKKEIIKVGGERVSPREIEEVILSIPEIISCSISAVNDLNLGEAIKADININKEDSDKITPVYIKQFCALKLAAHKIPSEIIIQNKVVISATGKNTKK